MFRMQKNDDIFVVNYDLFSNIYVDHLPALILALK